MRFVSSFAAIALAACSQSAAAALPDAPASAPAPTLAPAAAKLPLGCHDQGIYADLDAQVTLSLPAALERDALRAVIDDAHATLVVYERDWPLKVYPLGRGTRVVLPTNSDVVSLRDADAAELAPFVSTLPVRHLHRRERLPPGDRDDDGIPDPLDVLVGGKKLVANGASYTQDYFRLPFPGGDAPRDKGSCADVVVRALRNAGLDLQVALAEDIARAPAAYPMVKKPDASIDHRRVRTMLPYFRRHLAAHGTDPADAKDPFRPGDVVFMDTLPGKPGPDHVGIVSDVRGESGFPLVINNWTDGYRDAEMDLLGFVPVVARFRL
jgi:uncharacterized protein YijF (DUF1287 family)